MHCISWTSFLLCIYSWGSFVRSARELPHVTDYEVIKPKRLGRARRSLSSEQAYPEELQYALTIEGNEHKIHLEKNRMLIGKNYTETFYLEDGTEVTTSPNYTDHCYYHGHIQDIEDSSVSVGICSGIRGFVRAEQQVYLIEPLGASADGEHAVYRREHLRSKRSTCGNSNESFYDHEPRVSGVYKPNGATSKLLFDGKKRFVELFLVIDNTEYKTFGRDKEKITARALEVANHVDKLYRPLNIRVMLIGLEIWSDKDQITVSTDSDQTLTNFLQWRQHTLLKKSRHDNAQLITGIDFDGETVGLAPTSAMCTGMSGAVNQDHAISSFAVASTIAHEMGHNLGMSHDEAVCACGPASSNNCVMKSTIGSVYPEAFSSCSKEDLVTFLQNSNPSCLMDTPRTETIFGGPVCGNAFLEAGEECDCGKEKECRNPCCNATTCRLTEGSRCAEGDCCENCQLKQVGSLCRESADECDLAEYCSGRAAQCPRDVFKLNGLPCNRDQGYCYNGQCPTHLQHCTRLWGSGAQVAPDVCFHENTFGTKHAYCRKTKSGTVGCTTKNIKCGKLFCIGGKTFPITKEKVDFTLRGCKIAVDNTGAEDVSMVPTGTKCEDKKVCYENACQDVKIYGGEDCSSKCNNHGVCNHERQCHCDPGWDPPYCNVKSDLGNGNKAMVVGVAVSVTLLILLTLVVGGLMCRRKDRKINKICTSKKEALHPAGLSNPLFLSGSATNSPRCGPPRISRPTFVESSAAQTHCPASTSVAPSRAPPQPPKKVLHSNTAQFVKPSVPPPASSREMAPSQGIPLPPTKPLPPFYVHEVKKPNLHPPLPPMKPAGPKPSGYQHQAAAGGPKFPPKPPTKPR